MACANIFFHISRDSGSINLTEPATKTVLFILAGYYALLVSREGT